MVAVADRRFADPVDPGIGDLQPGEAGPARPRRKLFLIPEEYDTPRELRATDEYTYENRWHALKDGFLKAAVDPLLNALACAMGTARHNRAQAIETVRGERIGKAIDKGPEQLDGATRLALLSDPVALSRLHTRVWEEDRDDWLGRWRKAEADDPTPPAYRWPR